MNIPSVRDSVVICTTDGVRISTTSTAERACGGVGAGVTKGSTITAFAGVGDGTTVSSTGVGGGVLVLLVHTAQSRIENVATAITFSKFFNIAISFGKRILSGEYP